ncbi:hypothetical protein L3X37_00625 [Sabulilitoribacter arenilitoris]|uniref:Uncharacterized protein n=1 Tax=Wocania arenilitoris TaxID=2044858 RepID=A0AAE3EMP6_9FLAO|nr:hypothetical protein [Wocania arenilitoris]MCF7566869.1 hypothetical protein [Wocania arenilitoris]
MAYTRVTQEEVTLNKLVDNGTNGGCLITELTTTLKIDANTDPNWIKTNCCV